MNQPPTPHDDPRDAHLLAALRHAPDRDLAPPPQLTAAILDHAQRALHAKRAGAPSWRSAWARLWQPAPMAAFGILAMATLIGVLWSGQEIPDATPSLRSVPAAAPAAPGKASELSAPPAAVPLERPAPAPRATRPPPAPPAPAHERQAAAQEPEARRDAAAVATTPAPAAARARSEMAAGALGAAAPAAVQSPVSPLLKVDAEIEAASASDAARVRWRVAAQRVVAHQAAQRDWWADVLRATQGRWQAVASGAGDAEAVPLLLIDGASRGSFAFEAQALVWREAGGATWRAPIEAETLRRWQASLARW